VRLPFAASLPTSSEVGGQRSTRSTSPRRGNDHRSDFDAFASSLLVSRDWLRGKGGGTGDGYFCVEVTAPGRPYLYVNPEGGDYARYVARLG
jgi:hypothetical protein